MIQKVKQWIKDNPDEYKKIQQGPEPTKRLQQEVEKIHGQFFWNEKGGMSGDPDTHERFRLEPKGTNKKTGERAWGAKSESSRARHKSNSEKLRAKRAQDPVHDLLEFAADNGYTADQVFDYLDSQKKGRKLTKIQTQLADALSAYGVDVGHIGSLEEGYPNTAENQELEDRRINQRKRGTSPTRQQVMGSGVMPSHQAQFVQFANPDLPLPHKSEYTKQQQLQIRSASDPNVAIQQIEADKLKVPQPTKPKNTWSSTIRKITGSVSLADFGRAAVRGLTNPTGAALDIAASAAEPFLDQNGRDALTIMNTPFVPLKAKVAALTINAGAANAATLTSMKDSAGRLPGDEGYSKR